MSPDLERLVGGEGEKGNNVVVVVFRGLIVKKPET